MNIKLRPQNHIEIAFAAIAALAMLGFVGCTKQAPEKKSAQSKQAADAHHHDHGEEGPHHGQLVELGDDEYHAELVHDDAAQKVTVYVLDSKAKGAVPIAGDEIKLNLMVGDKPTQFALKAAPDAGDAAGKSSRFELADKDLIEALDAEGAKARLTISIDGKSYIGEIGEHHHHDEKGHKH
jgi:hypothetical protein